ncbi:hypothetical protein CHK_1524 [Christensenella hongkongensis]|uniref:Uncharacterized protein n=1 Tax=Christensenella hongkongensis TaxID=270498 RepID=A0A0M2NL31_9FIRM|nr:hypothetical protein CHK_1524 [Christensenella hongkongensis]
MVSIICAVLKASEKIPASVCPLILVTANNKKTDARAFITLPMIFQR